MKKTYVITIENYAETDGYITVYDTDGISDEFTYDDYKIVKESPGTDCEDFNDTARWLTKTILAIKKLEKEDEYAHEDWSAEDKYEFKVSITKKGEKNENLHS